MSPHSPFNSIMQESNENKRHSLLGQRLSALESELENMCDTLEIIEKSLRGDNASAKLLNKASELRKAIEDLEFERDAIETEMDNITYEACIE